MDRNKKTKPNAALYETILSLRDLDECVRFFQDLCTPIELRSMEQRFEVAVELERGAVYSEILEKTGASSATVSRVRRAMLDGGAGGVMRDVIFRERIGAAPKREET
ncbi:MAG: TrpR-like protein [Oscillibacter sp.]|nr:TrpR-like protein [Oscillibacter sp.]